MSKEPLPYAEAAEIRTVEGWACKTCGRFWGDRQDSEHAARYCCAKQIPCSLCGKLRDRMSFCRECQDKKDQERWERMPQRDYDGNPVVVYGDDRYLFDEDEVLDYLADLESPGDAQLEHAKPFIFTWRWTVSELLGDDCGPDFEWDTREIDDQIAEWVQANAPKYYEPSGERVSDKSLAELAAQRGRRDW